MARPIEATPVLKGKDAREFLDEIRLTEPISDQRVRWLEKLAEESKAAENRGTEVHSTAHARCTF